MPAAFQPAGAQTLTTGDPMEIYLRWVLTDSEASGLPSFNLRPVNVSAYQVERTLPADHPWSRHPYFETLATPQEGEAFYTIYTPQLVISHNNEFPVGQNDGALWQGRGYNYSFTTGVGYRYGPLKVVIRPVLVHSQNLEFELSNDPQNPGLSPFAMALTNADLPQRFGEDPFSRLDLGDSFIQFYYRGWSAGISNERIWSGPAVHNPLMFSNNAPGFVHGFIGTEKPYKTLGGHIETRWFWGGLRESDYFDDDPSNNLRYITGLIFNYSPRFLPGLHVGFTRSAFSFYPDNGIGLSELFMVFRPSPRFEEMQDTAPEDAYHAKGSVFIRWVFPESGFETYAEWGRNDFRRDFKDMVLEPELNRGYVLGLIKRFTVDPKRRVVFNAEITSLENSTVSSQFRDEANIWYEHDVIRQGFTNRGQVLGAGIGPGSSTQYAGLSFYDSWGMISVSANRIVHHNDRLFRHADHYHTTLPRPWMTIRRLVEAEMRYGIFGMVHLPYNLELQIEYQSGKIENRYNNFDRTEGGFGDDILFDDQNTRFAFTLRYNLPGWSR